MGAADPGSVGAERPSTMASTYFMYYSATPDAHNQAGPDHVLAIATSDLPAGPFVDIGRPFLNGDRLPQYRSYGLRRPAHRQASALLGVGLRADQGSGAWRRPHLVRSRAVPPPTSSGPTARDGAFPRLVEASWVIRHDDFYYLFYSGDNCCGPHAEYGHGSTVRKRDGPVRDPRQAKGVPNSLILSKSERWLAPGHNSIVTDRGRGVDRLSRD